MFLSCAGYLRSACPVHTIPKVGNRTLSSRLNCSRCPFLNVFYSPLDSVQPERNAVDVLSLIDILKKRQIAVRILNLGIDTSGAGGRLFLLLLAGFAEFERNIIRERIMAGLDVARAKGKRPGRRSTLSPEKTAQARAMKQRGLSSREVSELLQVSRMTAWRAMNSLKAVP
ncbi:hypothetical protein predicted by Glimmer/Critica [Acetobacter senegalensis]|uniref:Resolvase/invertase-type recombinase catalytic domain-containing protein n=1 Tax=Acetobacter senegalensis TaxID=446692 RepID=A0A0U5F0K7_9PROT|nr:hypothetical protein predicted by Glimmer/Critica [Acetobacter senegalensis]